jgi:hypothetical protein
MEVQVEKLHSNLRLEDIHREIDVYRTFYSYSVLQIVLMEFGME